MGDYVVITLQKDDGRGRIFENGGGGTVNPAQITFSRMAKSHNVRGKKGARAWRLDSHRDGATVHPNELKGVAWHSEPLSLIHSSSHQRGGVGARLASLRRWRISPPATR